MVIIHLHPSQSLLSEAVENGKIKDGDIVVLVGFGGGLSWGAASLKWGK